MNNRCLTNFHGRLAAGIALALVVGRAWPAQAAATLSCTSIDSGGSRVTTANYTLDSSLGGIGDLLTVGSDSLWGGYPAQLNNPPTVPVYVMDRGTNLTTKVLLSNLVATVTDVDGDPVFFVGLANTSTNGGVLATMDGWLLYAPPAGFNGVDGFTWTVQDAAGDQTVGSIIVQVVPPYPAYSLSLISITAGGGSSVTLTFIGIPNLNNVVQYTDNLLPPITWNTLGTVTAGPNGTFQLVDPTAGNSTQRFYRTLVQSP
jgi:hypothetical protein